MDISQVEMEDSENEGQELEVDEQVLDSNLVDAKFECQQEDQNLGRKRSNDKKTSNRVLEDRDPNENKQLPVELTVKEAQQSEKEGLVNVQAEPGHIAFAATAVAEGDVGPKEVPQNEDMIPDAHPANHLEPVTPNSPVKSPNPETEDDSKETPKNWLDESKLEEEDETGTSKDQAAFMKELESFYRERAMEFKPPRFYGQPLNLLKLWRAVIKLGGYDRVTGFKLWRQIGESFHPPKTCTTVSWTFRIFYEKALLEYERHKSQSGELELAVAALPEPSSVENEANGHQTPGSGRARRDAAARAMQGWPYQRRCGYVEVGEPIIKDKNFNNMPKREKSLKSIGSVKNKRPTEVEHSVKAARTEIAKQLVTTVVDIGPPADWVKINVRETRDCFEVYALVPGLLREEVRVQSDPAGRLIITGQPEQADNPWGITAFKKVVSLPARIDPLQTSAVVSLHGRLFVRVPFEQSNI
ncbi:AT-rich interactive domain-containing protein 5-like [Actinidia eriantha]|uniref:AT-rich interactive domain-containing protein 5-like n=1 Tax=Actinidia eriantha TaxID=165200 RepID=UPI00258AEF13|nr:AT-rich interactive domain-containing protein 5-like [Actinidia eriantha]XP_057489967.1 AT-rich interactive domain-containing protein 5-like [Actinidia eriantha]